jgi:hypothetical protein
MKLKEPFVDRSYWRIAHLMGFMFLVFALNGCGWWNKNVAEPAKGVTSRRLTITSDPPGANVFVDDVFQGRTPLTLNYKVGMKDLFKGFVIVVQKDGYLPVRREVGLNSQRVTFRLIRQRRKPAP